MSNFESSRILNTHELGCSISNPSLDFPRPTSSLLGPTAPNARANWSTPRGPTFCGPTPTDPARSRPIKDRPVSRHSPKTTEGSISPNPGEANPLTPVQNPESLRRRCGAEAPDFRRSRRRWRPHRPLLRWRPQVPGGRLCRRRRQCSRPTPRR